MHIMTDETSLRQLTSLDPYSTRVFRFLFLSVFVLGPIRFCCILASVRHHVLDMYFFFCIHGRLSVNKEVQIDTHHICESFEEHG
jgi:hypothetical protein